MPHFARQESSNCVTRCKSFYHYNVIIAWIRCIQRATFEKPAKKLGASNKNSSLLQEKLNKFLYTLYSRRSTYTREERKRYRSGCAESGAARRGKKRGRRRPGLEAKGLTISAYITRLKGRERVREGPGTGNLLLYTRPEIRMYHSHTHMSARARAIGLSLD